MAVETLTLEWIDGRTTDSSLHTRTGHGESSENRDAMWSFKAPAKRIKKLSIPFKWDNGAGGTGNWNTNVDMYVAITKNESKHTSDMSKYRYAANSDSQRIQQVTMATNGNSGSNTAVFTDLELEVGETYYVRVNAADGVYKSIKCFEKAITATYEKRSGIRVNVNGEWKEGIPFVNVNGEWKEGTPFVNINGIWKEGI